MAEEAANNDAEVWWGVQCLPPIEGGHRDFGISVHGCGPDDRGSAEMGAAADYLNDPLDAPWHEHCEGHRLVRRTVTYSRWEPVHAGADGYCPDYGRAADPCLPACASGVCFAASPSTEGERREQV